MLATYSQPTVFTLCTVCLEHAQAGGGIITESQSDAQADPKPVGTAHVMIDQSKVDALADRLRSVDFPTVGCRSWMGNEETETHAK